MKREGLTFVVLIGYNKLAPNFVDVVYGRPKDGLMGRGLKAFWACLKFKADYLFFTTGIVANDKPESIAEKDFLRSRLQEEEFPIEEIFSLLSANVVKEYFWHYFGHSDRVFCDLESKNTKGNLEWAKEKVENVGGKELRHTVVLVSDPAHMPRVMLNASQVFGTQFTIVGVESDIPYSGELGDGIALEPPILEHIRPELMELIKKGSERMGQARNNPAKL